MAMAARIRHCVECRTCSMRYVLSATRYANGAYIMVHRATQSEEYILYCSCSHPAAISTCTGSEVRRYKVSRAAHARGYGSPQEIVFWSAVAE